MASLTRRVVLLNGKSVSCPALSQPAAPADSELAALQAVVRKSAEALR